MTRTITARLAARHGVPKNATVVSRYSGRSLAIIGARVSGCQVELIPEIGKPFCVDPSDLLDVAR